MTIVDKIPIPGAILVGWSTAAARPQGSEGSSKFQDAEKELSGSVVVPLR